MKEVDISKKQPLDVWHKAHRSYIGSEDRWFGSHQDVGNTMFDNTMFDNTMFDNTKFDNTKFDNSKFDNTKFDHSKFVNSKFDNSKFDNTKFTSGASGARRGLGCGSLCACLKFIFLICVLYNSVHIVDPPAFKQETLI
jgi:hypothetical protein